MAFTATLDERSTFGNKAVHFYTVTADGATGTIVTGLGSVDHVQVTPKSMASSPYAIRANEGVASTSIAGTVGVTGVTSGDDFYMVVFGR